jgi:hypothetical protein
LSNCCCWWYNGLNNRGSIPSKCWDFQPLRPDRLRAQEGSYSTDNAPPFEVVWPKRGYDTHPHLMSMFECVELYPIFHTSS